MAYNMKFLEQRGIADSMSNLVLGIRAGLWEMASLYCTSMMMEWNGYYSELHVR